MLQGGRATDGRETGSGDAPAVEAGLAELAVLIPAWKPDGALLDVVRTVSAAGFGAVVVVDDGSGPAFGAVFARVAAVRGVRLLQHARNRGKGRALKTGFAFLCGPDTKGVGLRGVVTADADGQHRPEDIMRVGRELLDGGAPAVLGVRGFLGRVPLRSRVGNGMTRGLFRLLSGRRMTDTQTGLRGLRRELLPGLVALRGERYEYEMSMLWWLCRRGSGVREVAIATVYEANNCGSHFEPVRDSLRVYGALLRGALERAVARRRPSGGLRGKFAFALRPARR